MKNRTARYAIDYAASLGTIGLAENANGVRLGKVDALAIAYDREGNLLNWVGNVVPINLSQAAWDQSSRDGLRIQQVLDLPAGDIFLRVGLYDLSSGRFGSMEIPLMGSLQLPALIPRFVESESAKFQDLFRNELDWPGAGWLTIPVCARDETILTPLVQRNIGVPGFVGDGCRQARQAFVREDPWRRVKQDSPAPKGIAP